MAEAGERRRQQAGRGASVGGAPAEDALDALVQQFSERSSFVRELIQNSLDAGAGQITVRLWEAEGGRLCIAVEDDGEGMDRATIEGYLLTLFRSSKERDLTKIGKFGVGFVSLFAVRPELVVVNTGRDGVAHRVLFDARREYTLAELDVPVEGTTVTLWVACTAADRAALAVEVRSAAHYWCRYARAEIWTEGEGPWGWPLERVAHPFAVSAPLQVEERAEGLRVVMGFTADPVPLVGYYNHGLTLLEAREAVVPGVTFRVEARTLEHTLTRDNVIRDRNHQEVVRRVEGLARGRLRSDHLAALRSAVAAGDGARQAALLSVCHLPIVDLPGDLACLRTADGAVVGLDALRSGGLLGRLRSPEVLYASGPGPVVTALSASGRVVLLGPPEVHPEVRLAESRGLGPPRDALQHWICPALVAEGHPLVAAAAADWRPCLPARFAGCGAAVEGRLVSWQREPGTLEARTPDATLPRLGRVTLLVNIEHPVFVRIARLPVVQGGPLLRRALALALALALDAPLDAPTLCQIRGDTP